MRGARGPEALLVAVGLLVAAAVAAVLATGRAAGEGAALRGDVHRATGGLGLGTGLDLSPCPHGFDPRVEGTCAGRHGVVPGDDATCPRHRGVLPPP